MDLGYVPASSTIYLTFTTQAATGAAGAPSTAFESADVKLYKDGSATGRSSQAGWTMTSPFNSITGLHVLAIDLSDNTDAGFYAAGHFYTAVLSPDTETVAGVSVVAVIGTFFIGPVGANMTQILGTAVSSPATAGILDVNVKNIDNDAASASGTVTFPNATLASTTNITAGTITTVTNLTNAPTSGDFTSTMKTSIGTAVAASAVASVTGNVGGNVTGSVGSVVGSVGSVAGNVGGNVVGTVTTVTGNVNGNVGGNVTGSVGSVSGNVGGNVTGSIGSLATQAKADVNAEADAALADYDGPTHAEMTAELGTADDATLAAIAALTIPTAAANAAAVLAVIYEGTDTFQDFLREVRAVLLGVSSGHPSSPVFKGANGTTTRVSASLDGDGNRSSVVLDAT